MAKIVCSEPLWWIITSQLAGFFKDKKSETLATIYPKSFYLCSVDCVFANKCGIELGKIAVVGK